MKYLLKIITVMVITISLLSCNSEPFDMERSEPVDSIVLSSACNDNLVVVKFINESILDSSFIIYDSADNTLATEIDLAPGESSLLKSFSPNAEAVIKVGNVKYTGEKVFDAESCNFYTFVLDVENVLQIQVEAI
mgnify:FL=1